MPTRKLVERVVCFRSFLFLGKQTISCWWSVVGQIKISFAAIYKYWQTLHQQKFLRTWLQGQWLLKALHSITRLFKLFSLTSLIFWPCLGLRLLWLEKRSWQISLPKCWTLKSLIVEKILAVKDATYAVAERNPDKNEKFRLSGTRALTSAIPVQCSNQYVLYCYWTVSKASRILCLLTFVTLPRHIYSVRIQNTFSKIRVVYIKRYAYQSELWTLKSFLVMETL